MALWNVPFLIRTPLRMAGFRMGGGGGGVRIFFQRSRQRNRHSFHPSSCRSSPFKKLLIIIIFIIIIIATTTTTIIIIIIIIIITNYYSLQKPDKISHGLKVVVIYFSLQNCILDQNTIIIFVVFLTLGSRFKSLHDIKVLRYKNYNSLVTQRPFPRMTRQKWLSGRLPMPWQSFKYYVRGSSH